MASPSPTSRGAQTLLLGSARASMSQGCAYSIGPRSVGFVSHKTHVPFICYGFCLSWHSAATNLVNQYLDYSEWTFQVLEITKRGVSDF